MHGLDDVLARVRSREEARLELRRSEINPRIEHAVEKFRKARAVAVHGVGEIVNRLVREVAAEHRTAAVESDGDVRGLCGVTHSGFESSAEFFETLVGRAVLSPPRRGEDTAPYLSLSLHCSILNNL